jgi:hypothetical protein
MLTPRVRLAFACALSIVVILTLAPLIAQTPTMLVVATGLDNPRGLTFGTDGALYVAEAGRGGTSPLCLPAVEPPFPLTRCLGPTGAITRVSGLLVQRRVVTNLPSVAGATGAQAQGPNDVDFGFGSMWITLGLGGDPAARAALEASGIRMGWLARASMNGDWSYQLDLAKFETDANPDPARVDSNPFKLLIQANRAVFVDAGGNSVNQIGPDLAISNLAVLPPVATPTGGTTDSVPTSVAAAGDGNLYVGQLTGFPFTPNAASLWRVPEGGGTPVPVATGFTMIIDLAIGSDGAAYVLEHDIDGLLGPSRDGRLTRVTADGSRTVIASAGLTWPGGVAIGVDRAAYVTRNASLPGVGDVVRIPLP